MRDFEIRAEKAEGAQAIEGEDSILLFLYKELDAKDGWNHV